MGKPPSNPECLCLLIGQTLGLGSVAPTPPDGVSVIPQSLTEHLACRALGSTVTTCLCEGPGGFPEV